MDGEKDKTESPDASVPPKLDLKQAVASQNAAPKKATTRIEMASAAMIPEEKSKTTRINLGSFGVEPSGTPKTIKIQRPSEASTIKLNRPGTSLGTPPPPTPAVPPPSPAQSKRQTSRISLQEALTSPTEGQAATTLSPAETPVPGAGPKTIRIKRPGDGAGPVASTQEAAAPSTEPALESGPPTQRKTIKLRRPGVGADGEPAHASSVVLPKSAADFAAAQAAGPQEDAEEPGALFGVLSLVATLVCAVLVYMLCVQALPSLGLTWTGQVPTLH